MDILAEEVANHQIAELCYILGNCSVHNGDDITEVCRMFGGDFNFLPLYSPMLNPIEGVHRARQVSWLLATSIL
jgi:transposase